MTFLTDEIQLNYLMNCMVLQPMHLDPTSFWTYTRRTFSGALSLAYFQKLEFRGYWQFFVGLRRAGQRPIYISYQKNNQSLTEIPW